MAASAVEVSMHMIPGRSGGAAGTPRRSLLQRALVGLGAAVSVPFGSAAASQAARDPGPTERISLDGRAWHVVRLEHTPGVQPVKGERLAVCGELVEPATGEKVGEFYAVCVEVDAPFGPGPSAAETIEWHTFRLRDGTLTGMGTSAPPGPARAPEPEQEFAIVGGTGRYLGARGSYVARQGVRERGGNGTAAFRLTLLL